jgi:hypothetical protein
VTWIRVIAVKVVRNGLILDSLKVEMTRFTDGWM